MATAAETTEEVAHTIQLVLNAPRDKKSCDSGDWPCVELGWLSGWLVGWVAWWLDQAGRLACWLAGLLVGWQYVSLLVLVGMKNGWLAGWLVGCVTEWLVLAGRLIAL